jgi:hypothetical protein
MNNQAAGAGCEQGVDWLSVLNQLGHSGVDPPVGVEKEVIPRELDR